MQKREIIFNPAFFVLFSFLLLAGHFLPWAAHATSALTQSGHELAFSTHFTPGAGVFANEWFFTPAWCAALLLACSLTPTLSQWERGLRGLIFGGIALVIASLGFPPYPQVLTAFRSPDYRVQFFVTLLVMAGVIALLLIPAKRISPKAPALIALTCGVLSLIPVMGFLAVKPAIETLYGAPVSLGTGWWMTLGTCVMLLFLAVRAFIIASRS